MILFEKSVGEQSFTSFCQGEGGGHAQRLQSVLLGNFHWGGGEDWTNWPIDRNRNIQIQIPLLGVSQCGCPLKLLFRCMKSVCTSLARILSPGLTLSCSSQDLALSACRWKQFLLQSQLDKDKDNTGSRQSGASTQPIRGTQSHLWPSACCKGTSSGGEYQLKHPNKDLH